MSRKFCENSPASSTDGSPVAWRSDAAVPFSEVEQTTALPLYAPIFVSRQCSGSRAARMGLLRAKSNPAHRSCRRLVTTPWCSGMRPVKERRKREREGPPGKRMREESSSTRRSSWRRRREERRPGPAKSRPAGLPWQATAAGEAGKSGPLHRRGGAAGLP
jgi:hypothetical protein